MAGGIRVYEEKKCILAFLCGTLGLLQCKRELAERVELGENVISFSDKKML